MSSARKSDSILNSVPAPDGGAGYGHGAVVKAIRGDTKAFALIKDICEQARAEEDASGAGPLQVDIRVVD